MCHFRIVFYIKRLSRDTYILMCHICAFIPIYPFAPVDSWGKRFFTTNI